MHTDVISDNQLKKISKRQQQLAAWCDEARILQPSDPQQAIELSDKVLASVILPDDAKYLVEAHREKGICYYHMGRSPEALDELTEAQRLHRQHTPDDKQKLISILYGKANVYIQIGNNQLAIDTLLACVSLSDGRTRTNVYNNLGLTYNKIGKKDKAAEYFQKVIALGTANNNLAMIICGKCNLLHVFFMVGATQAIEQETLNVLDFIRTHSETHKDFVSYEIFALGLLGEIYKKEHQFEKAIEMKNQAIDLAKHISYYAALPDILCDLSKVYLEQGDEKNALIHVHKTLDYLKKYEFPHIKKDILESVIHFYKKNNQPAKAFPFHEMLVEVLQGELIKSRDKNLQKIISEREQEIQLLEGKNKEIEEQNAILKQFAYIISHDLREPIRGITGFANMLNNKYAQNLDKTGNEYLKFILSEAHSMNRNLARLLRYTTIEKNTDNHKEIDLQHVINDIQQQYQDESFQLNISCEGVPIKMQHQHAILLLSELINNAVQFRKENEDCRIEIKNELKEGHYHLSIKDYGIGIAPAYHDKIFKIFNKINKWEGEGAGVGLAICERIVHLYKGAISVESTPKQFTTFRVLISV